MNLVRKMTNSSFRKHLDIKSVKTLLKEGRNNDAPVYFFNMMAQLRWDYKEKIDLLKFFYKAQLCHIDATIMTRADRQTLELLKLLITPGSIEDEFIDRFL